MSDIRIRVGASLDRSVTIVFAQLAQAAKQARAQVAAELNKSADDMVKASRKGATDRAKVEQSALTDSERRARERAKAYERVEREVTAMERREWRARGREQERAIADGARAARRAADQQAREENRRIRERQRFVHRLGVSAGIGHSVRIGAAGALGLGLGVGREMFGIGADVMRSLGYNFGMASHMEAAVRNQLLATQISHEGYMPTDPRNATRVGARTLETEAYKVGERTGFSGGDVLGGLQAFVGKTGDLQTGRDVLEEMAKLSKATGTNLEDMVSASADVSNQLGDVDNKGELVKKVMRQIAGEGKLGAVPIRSMASQMAKVAAAASQMEGDVGKNIGLFGAITQEARLHGGASSATMAATSITALMSVFGKGARNDAFNALGISTYNKAEGKTRNIQDIIVESLQKTQGATNPKEAMNKLFGSVQAYRAVGGFETIFRSTYAGAHGSNQERMAAATAAVTEEFNRLKNVTVAQEELEQSFSEAMSTSESQAQTFNTVMDETAAQLRDELLPAAAALAPIFVDMAKDGAELIQHFLDFLGIKKDTTPKNAFDVLGSAGKAIKTAQTIVADEGATASGARGSFTTADIAHSKVALAHQKKLIESRRQEYLTDIRAKEAALPQGKDLEDLEYTARTEGGAAAASLAKIRNKQNEADRERGAALALQRTEESIDTQVKALDRAFDDAMTRNTMKVVVVEDKSKQRVPKAARPATSGTDGEDTE